MISRRLLQRYSVEQLKDAVRMKSQLGKVEALESKRDAFLKQVAKIDRKLSKLGSSNGSATVTKPGRKRRSWKLSAETRRKMSEAAKRRYAGKGKADTPASGKRKRKPMSPETRAKMAAAAKTRWAKIKGEKKPD